MLEHIPKENAHDFIAECFRILKLGGIIRIVVPDLEIIVDEYKKLLKENLENPNDITIANYDWILLEMYDQTVRNYSGGQMAKYLQQEKIVNEKYVIDRIGYVGRNIRNNYLNRNNSVINADFKKTSIIIFKKVVRYILHKVIQKIKLQSKASKIGTFRLGGEIHMWMYDRFYLARLLKDSGFIDISVKKYI